MANSRPDSGKVHEAPRTSRHTREKVTKHYTESHGKDPETNLLVPPDKAAKM